MRLKIARIISGCPWLWTVCMWVMYQFLTDAEKADFDKKAEEIIAHGKPREK